MRTLIPVITLILGVSLGFFFGQQHAEKSDQSLNSKSSPQSQGLVKRDEFDREIELLEKQKAETELALKASQGREKAQGEEIAYLEAEGAGWKRKIMELEAKILAMETRLKGSREERLKRIEARFVELKGEGLQNFINSNAMGKLVADLRQEGDVGLEAVLSLLKSDSKEERQFATTLLTMGMADSAAIDPLRDTALNDDDELTRQMASQALMRMEGNEVLPTLRDLAANASDEGVKVNSMFGLVKRGEGIEEAVSYFNNKENEKRMRLALGDGAFYLEKTPKIQPLIDAVVKDAMGSSRQDPVVEAAVNYYSSVKTPEALAALQQLASDPQLGAKSKEKVAAAIANFKP